MLQYKKSCDHCGERITHCMLKQYTMVQGCCPTGTLGVGRCLLHSAVHSTLVASPLLRGGAHWLPRQLGCAFLIRVCYLEIGSQCWSGSTRLGGRAPPTCGGCEGVSLALSCSRRRCSSSALLCSCSAQREGKGRIGETKIQYLRSTNLPAAAQRC